MSGHKVNTQSGVAASGSVKPLLMDATLELSNRVAVLTFNRDDVRNVLTGTGLVDDIEKTIQWVNQSRDVSVLVITGAGKAFSAGGNLKEMLGRNTTHKDGPYSGTEEEVSQRYREGIQRIPKAMESLKVPSIAAFNGAAIGAGFDLGLMCDMTLASESAKMGETFLSLGLIPGVGGAYWLTRRVGAQRAAELAYTGRVFDAREALSMGIVLEVVKDEELLKRTMVLANAIAAQPPLATRHSRTLLKSALKDDLKTHLSLCAQLQGECHNQEDHLEAVSAFLEKRKPNYLAK